MIEINESPSTVLISEDGSSIEIIEEKVEVVISQSGSTGPQGDTGPQGPQGIQGPPGNDGADGQDGENGIGVPAGGTTGQVLSKIDGTDYNTEWTDPSGGVTSHGDLTGLSSDDHLQYHTDARGDARYYTETELDAGQLDNRYYTETELDSGQLDSRYYTETESDANFEPKNANIQSHISSTSNPHSVTKTQVGLGNVVNADTTTTANITDSTNKRFVTDANLTVINNTSGTNTGDQNLSAYVQGPASATDSRTVFYNGTTGKLVKYLSVNNYGDTSGRHFARAFRSVNPADPSDPVVSSTNATSRGMYFPATTEVGFCSGGAFIAGFNPTGLSVGERAYNGRISNYFTNGQVPNYWGATSTDTGGNAYRFTQHRQESTDSDTPQESVSGVELDEGTFASINYSVRVWDPTTTKMNYYEGAVACYGGTKGIPVISGQTQTVAIEALDTNISFQMIIGSKGVSVNLEYTGLSKTTLYWDSWIDVRCCGAV